jgi:hypothetical protein
MNEKAGRSSVVAIETWDKQTKSRDVLGSISLIAKTLRNRPRATAGHSILDSRANKECVNLGKFPMTTDMPHHHDGDDQ